MWKGSSFALGLSVGGAPGPVNMLGHLAICLSVWTDGPPEGQSQTNHWICNMIQ